jgi:diphosphate-dependent phosphofructokinase
MAVIKNLELEFEKWNPMGIPIAKLMHLEERRGKLELIIEKSVVDLGSTAFKALKALRDKWVADDSSANCYRRPSPIRVSDRKGESRPITLILNSIQMS